MYEKRWMVQSGCHDFIFHTTCVSFSFKEIHYVVASWRTYD